MTYCPVCGTKIKQNARFCSGCGTPVHAPLDFGEQHSGEQHSEGQRQEPVDTDDVALRPKRRWRTVAVVAGSISLFVVLVVAAFFGVKTFLPSFFGFTFVNAAAFPDEAMRNAVSEQLDSDGDGILQPSDTEKVRSVIVEPERIVLSDSPSDAEGVAGGDSSSDGAGSVTSLNCARFFPNLETLACSGTDLVEIDISQNKALTYADLTGCGIASIDVSSNKSLTTLYCGEGVSVTGADEADLYCRDLITSATYTSADSSESTITIDYDASGRPLQATDGKGYRRLYSYGDDGVKTCMIFGDTMVTCDYDEQGRITSAKTTNSAGDVNDEYLYFMYGDSGLLSSFERSSVTKYKSEMYTSSLTFENGFLTKQNMDVVGLSGPSRTRSATWSYNAGGKVVSNTKSAVCEDISRSGDYNHEINWTFGDDGLCTSLVCDMNQVAGMQGTQRVDVSYKSDGTARATYTNDIYGTDKHTGIQDLETNADGYISSVGFDDLGTVRNGGKLSVSYVKRIAPLSERAHASGVPVFQIETIGRSSAFDCSVTNWFETADDQVGWLSLVEHDPWSDPLYYYGISDNAINVANEDAIASYDASLRSGKNQSYEVKESKASSTEQVTDEEKEYLEFMALTYWCAMGLGKNIGDGVVANQSAENLAQLIPQIASTSSLSQGYLREAQYIDKSRFDIEELGGNTGKPTISEFDGLWIVSSFCGKENTPDASALQEFPVSYDGTNFTYEASGTGGGCEIESTEMSKSGKTYTFKCRLYRTGSSIGSRINESVNYQVEAVSDADSMFGVRLVSMKPLS